MTWLRQQPSQMRRIIASFLSIAWIVALMMVLVAVGFWHPLENLAYTGLFLIRGSIGWDERVMVVAIDERSLQELGRFPFPRQNYVELLDALTEVNASVVAFDILFSESSPEDSALAAAMQRHGRVVLAQAWDNQGLPLLPTPTLQQAAVLNGHIYRANDGDDGISRSIQLYLQDVPTLAIAVAQVYSLVREAVDIPTEPGKLWLNWPGPTAQAPVVSFVDVLTDRAIREQLRDRMVLVGVTAAGLDPMQTPFDRDAPTTNIFLHAATLNNLLRGNPLTVPTPAAVLLGLAIGGLLLGLGNRAAHLQEVQRWQLAVGLCLGWVLFSFILFDQQAYWLPIASPIALVLAIALVTSVGDRWRDHQQLRTEILHLWQTYQADLVVHPRRGLKERLSRRFEPTSRLHQLAALADLFGRSQSTQAAIARNLSLGLVAAELDGLVWFVNPAALSILPLQLGDALAPRLLSGWMSAADWHLYLKKLQTGQAVLVPAIKHGDRWFELQFQPLYYSSERPTLESSASKPLSASNGHRSLSDAFTSFNPLDLSDTPQGLLLILIDITQQKQIEEGLTLQMRALEELNQMKDDFLNTVSHELRTPLSNMSMAIQMLQLLDAGERRDHYLKILQSECERETDLINNLLDLQRLDSKGKLLQPEPIDLSTYLPDLLRPFQQRVHSQQQTLQLQLLADELPIFTIDRSCLDRLLGELLNNACKYTPLAGAITLSVAPVEDGYRFEVSNTGISIPEAELCHIFEKFYRIPEGDPRNQGGTGLGLALVKQLVHYLNGSVEVTSQADRVTVILWLPAL